MKEKYFQTVFKNLNTIPGVFELKLCKANDKGKLPPFAFNRLAEHQRQALMDCSSDVGLYHKISDSFIGTTTGERRFPSPKPFDCMFLRNIAAYVVLIFYIPRKMKQFVYIDIVDLIAEEAICNRKSLTYERAVEISFNVVS